MSIVPDDAASVEIVAEPTLEELAATVNREHLLAEDATRSWLTHAISAGEALLAIRASTPFGEWGKWSDENLECSRTSAMGYMRVAFYKNELSMDMDRDTARRALRGFPINAITGHAPDSRAYRSIYRTAERTGKPPEALRTYVLDRRSEGLSWSAIGSELGVIARSVRSWVDDDYRKHRVRLSAEDNKRRRDARRLAAEVSKRKERESLAREARRLNDPLGHAHEHLRKLAQFLDAALSDGPAERRPEVREALTYVHKAEDAIVAALRGKGTE